LAEIGSAAGVEPDPLDRNAEVDETPRRLVRRVRPGDDEGRNVPRRRRETRAHGQTQVGVEYDAQRLEVDARQAHR